MGDITYWDECIACSFEENGITASDEQIAAVAADVETAHENYGMAFGPPPGPHPVQRELDEVRLDLQRERNKIVCPECKGRGSITIHGPVHSSTGDCWKCRGEGRIDP